MRSDPGPQRTAAGAGPEGDATEAPPFAGIVFDMDGVIIQSEGYWHEVRRDYVAQHGGRWNEEDQRAVMGANSRQWAEHIQRRFGLSLDIDEIIDGVVELLLERYDRDLPLIPGAREAVEALAGRYPMAVASSSPRRVIEYALDRAGIRDCFEAYVSSDQVENGKPAPDVYLAAAQRLGVAPREALAVEDSGNGIRSAKAAGMTVIAVPNPEFPPDSESRRRADLVVETVGEIDGNLVRSLEAERAAQERAAGK